MHTRPWGLLNCLPVWQSRGGSGQLLLGLALPLAFILTEEDLSAERTHIWAARYVPFTNGEIGKEYFPSVYLAIFMCNMRELRK